MPVLLDRQARPHLCVPRFLAPLRPQDRTGLAVEVEVQPHDHVADEVQAVVDVGHVVRQVGGVHEPKTVRRGQGAAVADLHVCPALDVLHDRRAGWLLPRQAVVEVVFGQPRTQM